MEEQLTKHIHDELTHIAEFPEEVYDNSLIEQLKNEWKTAVGLDESVIYDSSLDESILKNLNSDEILALKRLRFGVVGSEITNEQNLGKTIEESIESRIEYGGYIDNNGIQLEFRGDDGVINNFVFDTEKINFHTHPYQVDKWCYAPPSEDDIESLIMQSISKGKRIVSLVAAAEGIYIYYASRELLEKFVANNPNSLTTYSLLRELKNLLGYVSMDFGGISKNLFGGDGDSPVKRKETDNYQFKTPSPKKQKLVTISARKISIEEYLEICREMGIYINLYPYTVDAIPLPIEPQIGGTGKKYKINFTVL